MIESSLLVYFSSIACISSRGALNVIDRSFFKNDNYHFFTTLLLNSALPFLVSFIITKFLYPEIEIFNFLFLPGVMLNALMAQAVATAFSNGFRKMTVRNLTVSVKLADIFIPIVIFLMTKKIDFENLEIDFIAGTGHKSLLVPTGVGFLYVREPEYISTFIEGGSGGNSSISLVHPRVMPHKLESGTINMLSIVGLNGSLRYIISTGIQNIADHCLSLAELAWKELSKIPGVILYGSSNFIKKVPVISFNIVGALTSELGYIYDHKYNICLRAGLQCAPLLHQYMGTLPTGTIRVSFGPFNEEGDVYKFIKATKEISEEFNNDKACA